MPDLRRQALAGGKTGKTVSKKAQSKQGSRIGSPASSVAVSRNTSRAVSRQGSDDDDDDAKSDITNFSSLSLDDLMSPDEAEDDIVVGDWRARLQDCISTILTRKGSSATTREESYEEYNRILAAQYAAEEIESSKAELIGAFMRSVKTETTEKEVVLALKSFSLTCVTSPDDQAGSAHPILIRLIEHSESKLSKAAGIHALGSLLFFCDVDLGSDGDSYEFLRAIIESEGYNIGAGDCGIAVAAALEEFGLLLTLADDASELSRQAMEPLLEQLQSTDVRVQIAAGEAIALLYEKSYTPVEADEADDGPSSDDSASDGAAASHPRLLKRYEVHPRQDRVLAALTALTRLSTKTVAKKDRKALHACFSDVLTTVDDPRRGPRFQTALNCRTGARFGSRMTVTVPGVGQVGIDRWWKLLRLRALRRVLGGGLGRHWVENGVVAGVMGGEECLEDERVMRGFGEDRVKRRSVGRSRAVQRDYLGVEG